VQNYVYAKAFDIQRSARSRIWITIPTGTHCWMFGRANCETQVFLSPIKIEGRVSLIREAADYMTYARFANFRNRWISFVAGRLGAGMFPSRNARERVPVVIRAFHSRPGQ